LTNCGTLGSANGSEKISSFVFTEDNKVKTIGMANTTVINSRYKYMMILPSLLFDSVFFIALLP